MSATSRRGFLGRAAAAIAGGATARGAVLGAAASETAELVLTNGVILTMAEATPLAEAMAVRAGRILEVGPAAAVQRLIGRETEQIDLQGRSVSPGLIDAHSHAMAFGQMQLKFVLLRPPKVDSFDTLRAELARAARENPPGEWIVGRGFDQFREGRFPRRQELDAAVPDHPVLIIHWGGQFGVANTLALRTAGLLRADVEDPYGGRFLRDRRTGIPDGVLIHYPAIYSVYQPELDEREALECTAWGLQQLASVGVTCLHDNFCSARSGAAYVRLERAGRLPCRIRVYPYVKNLQHCQQVLASAGRYHGRLVRFQGIKLAVDGYALMYEVPPQHRELAIPMHPQELFEAIIAAIHQADLQADVHAVGDKGVDWTLAAYAKAAGSAADCRRRRHRIEHFPLRKLDSVRRAAELGVPVCVQPALIPLKARDMREKLGPGARQYVETMVPLATFTREGVPTAYGADVPAFPSHSPMESLRCAIDRIVAPGERLDPGEAVPFITALRHHTLGSAYAAFDEQDLGSLERGKAADFVIWKGDLRAVRGGADAAALQPLATYLAGQPAYRSDQSAT